MRLYASRPEPSRTPTPPSQRLLAGRFMPDESTIEIRPVPTQLNYAKDGLIQALRTAYANKPLIDERS
ncbi:hypothetical protein PS870_06316 [Pseudomonas fluorescens]|uniref:Uncharacterized protein n=1 Tax=Pseudomonas fluorescens TaxID=294 RepID=A0A5E7QGK2_PSEFL|nr:hypothetical protein PS870_06316 [Pseudomonas fluorescens]